MHVNVEGLDVEASRLNEGHAFSPLLLQTEETIRGIDSAIVRASYTQYSQPSNAGFTGCWSYRLQRANKSGPRPYCENSVPGVHSVGVRAVGTAGTAPLGTAAISRIRRARCASSKTTAPRAWTSRWCLAPARCRTFAVRVGSLQDQRSRP